MRPIAALFAGIVLVWAALLAPAADAASIFEELVMPGPLVEGHAKFQDKCANCHEPFSKKSQARLCLDCHKDVEKDIESERGFHGRRDDVKGTECKRCHTDHKGRDWDIVLLDRETFDHAASDFSLTGGHARVQCEECHVPGRKFRDAPSACVDCHRAGDPHNGRLGETCASCHSDAGWRKTRFDHGKTKFALEGAHKEVSCKSCHAGEKYKATPTRCNDCHRLTDVHGGRYGAKCATCHASTKWTSVRFDHDRETSFPLAGKHAKVKCDTCHSGDLYKQDLGKSCLDCHKADDAHKGRNGPKCADCHGTDTWRQVRFDHNKSTEFPLTGRHAKVQCLDCHGGDVAKDKVATACVSCHRLVDVHKGAAGKNCAACHKTNGWRKTAFDHDISTKFALKGKHAKAPCQACHKGSDPKAEKLSSGCVDCHETDDVHKGQEGQACALCHNERGWGTDVFFDHGLSLFPLIGLHAATPCEECHVSAAYKDTSLDCVSCHRADDKHEGALGPECALCHNPNSWTFWRFDHDKQTDYPLDGGHQGLACAACHKEPVKDKVSVPKVCAACHRKDDVHRGSFGSACGRCHVTGSFKDLRQMQ